LAPYNLPALLATVRANARTVDHIQGINRMLAAVSRVLQEA